MEPRSMTLQIVVRGQPAPQGSKSFKGLSKSGHGILVESSKKVKPWRQDVKAAAEAAIGEAQPLDGPLVVSMVFTLPKPKSAPKTRRTWPMRTPDLSKLVRSTEDALTDAGVWADDARVVKCVAEKCYPGEGAQNGLPVPGCIITIREAA